MIRVIGVILLVLLLFVGKWMFEAAVDVLPGGGEPSAASDSRPASGGPDAQNEDARWRMEMKKRQNAAARERMEAKARQNKRTRADGIREQLADLHTPSGEADGSGSPKTGEGEEPKDGEPRELEARADFGPELLEAVHTDFLPLMDECVELAHERDASLSGMLALQLNAIGDPMLGAVIERVEFGEQNDIVDAQLQECVRETAWSMILPPPEERGGHAFELTIPVEPKG